MEGWPAACAVAMMAAGVWAAGGVAEVVPVVGWRAAAKEATAIMGAGCRCGVRKGWEDSLLTHHTVPRACPYLQCVDSLYLPLA